MSDVKADSRRLIVGKLLRKITIIAGNAANTANAARFFVPIGGSGGGGVMPFFLLLLRLRRDDKNKSLKVKG